MRSVSVEHYENFPVASWLCPPAVRPAVVAIYRFARTADDLADEGDTPAADRLADLAAYRCDLQSIVAGTPPSARWPAVFGPLAEAMSRHALPPQLLHDLLDAFEQDVMKNDYADRAELLDYCRRSANPVGRLLLHLFGVADAASLAQSDAICTALQLANFWQDLSVDTRRGRLYAPRADCMRHGVAPASLLARDDSPQARALIADLVAWTRTLMRTGAPLVHRLSGRAGWELRLVVQGGSRILDRIEHLRFATLVSRPVLTWTDVPLMLARAFTMRATATPLAGQTT
jgi:squalene synthase HpnC